MTSINSMPTENLPTLIPSANASPTQATSTPTLNPTNTSTAIPNRLATTSTGILRPTVTRLAQTPSPTPTAIRGGLGPRSTVAPIVTSTIHFDFSASIVPLNDSKVSGILVDPTDTNLWYVYGQMGLYLTRDGGTSWILRKETDIFVAALAPQDSNQAYYGAKEILYASRDKGQNWQAIGKFDAGTSIRSLHIGRDGTIFVGLHWTDYGRSPTTPEGIYISRDRGANWLFSPFGSPHRGLIVWAIAQDMLDGTLYASTEIFNHPTPYKPPFFRSKDGGKTWEEISGMINWHVLEIQIRPDNGYVYAMTEGQGLFGSADHGDHWQLLSGNVSLTLTLDARYPNRLFGSTFTNALGQYGGLFLSNDGGTRFEQIGLVGMSIGKIALNGDSTALYVTVMNKGIFTTKIPLSAR